MDSSDEMERARLFWVFQQMSVDASPARLSGTGWRVSKTPRPDMARQTLDHLFAAAKRLRQVQIESRPMLEVLMRFDSRQTLFYVDPPYVSNTRTAKDGMYGVEWSDSDHSEFIEVVQNLEGFCIISGYACDLYEPLERAGWQREDRKAVNNSGDTRTESLWLSPNISENSEGRLF
jgi:DNA adenine methylase